MVTPDYYPLKKAAEILNCSEDDLIHLGANGRLDIAVLVGGLAIVKKTVIGIGGAEVSVSFGGFPGHLATIEHGCIKSHEAGLPARATLVIYYDREEGNSTVLTIVDPTEENGDLMRSGDLMMKDARLVIRHADLIRLQGEEPETEALRIGTGNHAGTEPKPRDGGYKLRDEFAIEQVKDKPELLEMRAGMIKVELQKASNLFTSGYDEWWRKNPVFNKSEPGRNPKYN
ncbi:MAG: hypothetical protein WCS87_07025 [Methylococcaceae bacterium]